ncbi:MAG: recombinase family protein [Nitrospirae bacterium]|nr:recombinase family protein [Nitrospirota bacterium]
MENITYVMYVRKSSESEDKQVASNESQIDELQALAKTLNIQIKKIFKEEQSAKMPGRPVFAEMLEYILNGNANGIICWKLDRLARNPVDGGSICWMLQQSQIHHIQAFHKGYKPTDNVIMMQVEFGMANQFIIDLSENTKRGQRTKIKHGWFPHKTPLGYLNNKHNLPDLPPIYKDTERFDAVKKLWSILLEKKCSIESLYDTACNMGLTSTNNKPVTYSKFYTIFRNPFYYGSFLWNGEIYPGKHEPMITKYEFDLVQDIISKRCNHKLTEHTFAFTGIIHCTCGAHITAETKTKHQKNGNNHTYTYYRCTRRVNRDCAEPAIKAEDLEQQIKDVLKSITIHPDFHKWAINELKTEQSAEISEREEITKALRKNLDNSCRRLDMLLEMRINNEITAEENAKKKEETLKEKHKYEELLSDTNNQHSVWLENAETLFRFAEIAKERFENGSITEKREILSCLGSNLLLTNKKLEISLDNSLAFFLKASNKGEETSLRLEPVKSIENTSNSTIKNYQNNVWGRWLGEVRMYLKTTPSFKYSKINNIFNPLSPSRQAVYSRTI